MENEADLEYVIRKLSSGVFVLSRIVDKTGLNMTTLLRIRDRQTKSPGTSTVISLKDYFINASK
jgi:hypothetical protein